MEPSRDPSAAMLQVNIAQRTLAARAARPVRALPSGSAAIAAGLVAGAVTLLLLEFLAIAGAATILRANYDVAALNRFLDEGEVVVIEIAVQVFVNPEERRMSGGAAQLERLKNVSGNFQAVGPALVSKLLHFHNATREFPELFISTPLGLDLTLEWIAALLSLRLSGNSIETGQSRPVSLEGLGAL